MARWQLGAWLTIALGKPFTLDYAKEHVDPSLWNDPRFIRTNVLMTGVWASTFTINAVLAFGKMEQIALSELELRTDLSYADADRHRDLHGLVSGAICAGQRAAAS
ncbi:MAG: hypothetical protein MZV49_07660 [Rhodopseudomonas palustris]|nr:hypothetical protein [Rhodopseudomonas palustris]